MAADLTLNSIDPPRESTARSPEATGGDPVQRFNASFDALKAEGAAPSPETVQKAKEAAINLTQSAIKEGRPDYISSASAGGDNTEFNRRLESVGVNPYYVAMSKRILSAAKEGDVNDLDAIKGEVDKELKQGDRRYANANISLTPLWNAANAARNAISGGKPFDVKAMAETSSGATAVSHWVDGVGAPAKAPDIGYLEAALYTPGVIVDKAVTSVISAGGDMQAVYKDGPVREEKSGGIYVRDGADGREETLYRNPATSEYFWADRQNPERDLNKRGVFMTLTGALTEVSSIVAPTPTGALGANNVGKSPKAVTVVAAAQSKTPGVKPSAGAETGASNAKPTGSSLGGEATENAAAKSPHSQVVEPSEHGAISPSESIEYFTAPSTGKKIEAAVDGNAAVPLDKVNVYARGKVANPNDELRKLQEFKQSNRKEFDIDPNNESRILALKKQQHNYDRSKAMGDNLDGIGLKDTPENNKLIVQHLLGVGKTVSKEKQGEWIPSTLEGPNGSVKVESKWTVLEDGRAYLSTLILKPSRSHDLSPPVKHDMGASGVQTPPNTASAPAKASGQNGDKPPSQSRSGPGMPKDSSEPIPGGDETSWKPSQAEKDRAHNERMAARREAAEQREAAKQQKADEPKKDPTNDKPPSQRRSGP